MVQNESMKQRLLEELLAKCVLSEMKRKVVQTICSLMDDQVYTKNDAVYALLEVVELICLEEKKVKPKEISDQLVL